MTGDGAAGGSADVTPGEAPVSRSGRRAEQRRAARRHQVRLLSIVLGLLALVAAGLAIYLAVDAPTPPVQPAADAAVRTQRTLLLQVQGPGRAGVAHVLLAHDPAAGEGAAVLVPPQVLVDVPGTGSVSLGRALATVSGAGVRNALSDLMAVTVDDGWVVDQQVLAALVDAVGGVEVDVDVPVVQGQTVVLTAGPQRVAGPAAVTFLSYLAPGEPEQSRLARVQEVLEGLVAALPAAPELTAVLQGLGPGSASTGPPAQLAAFLLGLQADRTADRLQVDVLPVVELDAGGEVTAFRTDPVALVALVDRLLGASVPAGAREGGNRVLVLNGVGTPGLGEAVRARLVPAGFVFAGADNAPSFGVATTQVLVPEATPEGQALGERVARALGLPGLQIGTQELGTVADVVVVIGADFRP